MNGDGRPTLEVENLRVELAGSGVDIVDEVTFTVAEGEALGLVGESGSGKTTVGLAILGHCRRGARLAGGEVRIDGKNILARSPAELRGMRGRVVSYVPQDPTASLNPALRIETQLMETLTAHGYGSSAEERRARLGEMLAEVLLPSDRKFLRRYPHQLSGGQQQRVGLAMAFACRPALIVLDEPTTGLDVSTQRHILDTMRSLCRGYGVAAVYVSHDLAVVSELVAEVAVMYAGRIVEAGPVSLLFPRPLHPYTRGLLDSVPTPDSAGRLTGIPGQQPAPGQRGPGCTFAPRCDLVLDECRAREPDPVMLSGRAVRCWRAMEPVAAPPLRPPRMATASAPPGTAVLSLRDVCASYGSVPVLSAIDLEVPPGSCVAVVGESGSGKTTLARCIVGLHRNWTGAIALHGTPLAHSARDRPALALKQIQCVFQNPYTSLNPRKTIGQIVAEPLQRFLGLPRGEQAGRVVAALDDVSLGSGFLDRYPDQLSGGERQRVAIARALVAEPELLVCDEITSALDVSVQAVIVELLREVTQRRHLAMVFITHNLALVRSVARSAVVLRQGEIVEAGPADQVLARPASDYTARLMADVPKLARLEPGR